MLNRYCKGTGAFHYRFMITFTKEVYVLKTGCRSIEKKELYSREKASKRSEENRKATGLCQGNRGLETSGTTLEGTESGKNRDRRESDLEERTATPELSTEGSTARQFELYQRKKL